MLHIAITFLFGHFSGQPIFCFSGQPIFWLKILCSKVCNLLTELILIPLGSNLLARVKYRGLGIYVILNEKFSLKVNINTVGPESWKVISQRH